MPRDGASPTIHLIGNPPSSLAQYVYVCPIRLSLLLFSFFPRLLEQLQPLEQTSRRHPHVIHIHICRHRCYLYFQTRILQTLLTPNEYIQTRLEQRDGRMIGPTPLFCLGIFPLLTYLPHPHLLLPSPLRSARLSLPHVRPRRLLLAVVVVGLFLSLSPRDFFHNPEPFDS